MSNNSTLAGVANRLVICPTQKPLRLFRDAAERRCRKVLRQTMIVADFAPLYSGESFSLLGPVVGGPAVALTVETLVPFGIKEIILLGTCGGLTLGSERLQIGSVVIPTGVISQEGTSRLYGASEETQLPKTPLNRELTSRLENNLLPHHGIVWSTDAPVLESKEKCEYYSTRGAIAVEMELAALAQVVKQKGLDLAAAFVVSDLLTEPRETGFNSQSCRESLRKVAEAVLDYLLLNRLTTSEEERQALLPRQH